MKGDQRLKLFSLQRRWLVGEKKGIVGAYKILKAMSKISVELLFTKSYGTKIRGLSLQLALGLKKRQYFAQSVPTFWQWLLQYQQVQKRIRLMV